MPAHIFRAPILSRLVLYTIRRASSHKLRRVTRSGGWNTGPKDAQVRLEGRRVVLLDSSQVGENWDDRCDEGVRDDFARLAAREDVLQV